MSVQIVTFDEYIEMLIVNNQQCPRDEIEEEHYVRLAKMVLSLDNEDGTTDCIDGAPAEDAG
jgi:hypothetical protein